MQYEVAARSLIGGRDKQDDSWSVTDGSGRDRSGEAGAPGGVAIDLDSVVLVADGLGGLGGGDAASAIVAKTLPEAYFAQRGDSPEADFKRALSAASAAVAAAQAETEGGESMATTVVAVAVEAKGFFYMSVGDSHLYRLRAGELHIVNPKHAYGAELDEQAFVSGREEAWAHAFSQGRREALTAAVGVDHSRAPDFGYAIVEPGDLLLLASDGLDAIPLEQLRRFLTSMAADGLGVAEIADKLVETTDRYGRAFLGGRHDNVTVAVVRQRALSDDASTIIGAAG